MDSISIIILSIAIIFIVIAHVILSKRVDKNNEQHEEEITSLHREIKFLENTTREIHHQLFDAEADLRDTKRELSRLKDKRFYRVEADGNPIVRFERGNITDIVTDSAFIPLLFTHEQANHITYLNDGVVKDMRGD